MNTGAFSKSRGPFLVFVLIGVSFGLYANTLTATFTYDDFEFVLPNEALRDLGTLPQLLNPFAGGGTGYRPVRNLTLALDFALWGENPMGFHLTNCLLHTLATLLVYGVGRRFFGDWRLAGVTALLFACHPVHTEAVANVSGRKDVLATIFFLAGFWVFLGLRIRGRPDPFRMALVWLCFGLSFFSKEMGITMPLVFFLWEVLCGSRTSLGEKPSRTTSRSRLPWLLRRGVETIKGSPVFYGVFFVAFGLVSAWVVFLKAPSEQQFWGGTAINNALTASRVHVHYLKLLIFPVKLVGDYSAFGFPVTTDPFHVPSLLAFGLVVGLVGLLVSISRSWPRIAFLGLFYFVTLLPVSQIKPHHELLAERFLYLPSIGFAGLTAVSLVGLSRWLFARRLLASRGALVSGALAVLLVVLYGIRTVDRNRDWQDDLTFWGATVEDSPRCIRARSNYAFNLFEAGRLDSAIRQMRAGLALDPSSVRSHYNLAVLYDRGKEIEGAIEHYREVLSLSKKLRGQELSNVSKRAVRETRYDAMLNLGLLYAREGRHDEADSLLTQLTQRDQDNWDALYNLAILRRIQGRSQEAARLMHAAADLRRKSEKPSSSER